MHAVVVAGSSLSGELVSEVAVAADLLVAVDAGADALIGVGLTPAILVGDMDSVSAAARQALDGAGVETVLLPEAKDETDLEAALRLLVDRGVDEITVCGALGGPRLDHLVGNLLLLTAPWLQPAEVRLVDDRHEIYLVRGDVVVEGEAGDHVSLFALTAEVEGVRTDGLLYPLEGETLQRCSTRSVSNELFGTEARVTHGAGTLLLVHYGRRRI